jgi:nanoRNase/pAp phosphatase (c-di-AMP/oligoRNAs hydrolase)
MWDKDSMRIVFSSGHSIINRTSKTDVGSLMLKHGGGGHRQVGACQVQPEQADKVLERLVTQMNEDG